jgi:hypothetical protein
VAGVTGARQSARAFCQRIGILCLSASLVFLIGAPLFFSLMNDAPFWDVLYEMSGVGAALWAASAACFLGVYLLGAGEDS